MNFTLISKKSGNVAVFEGKDIHEAFGKAMEKFSSTENALRPRDENRLPIRTPITIEFTGLPSMIITWHDSTWTLSEARDYIAN